MKALPAMLLLGAALSACTTVGNGRVQTLQAAEADRLLHPGQTTRAEAERLLGTGSALRFDGGWSTSHYVYRNGLPRFLDFLAIITSPRSPSYSLAIRRASSFSVSVLFSSLISSSPDPSASSKSNSSRMAAGSEPRATETNSSKSSRPEPSVSIALCNHSPKSEGSCNRA